MAKSASDAYRAIHESLYYAVESMLEDCNYEEAIKYTELMEKLERDKLNFVEEYTIDGKLERVFING